VSDETLDQLPVRMLNEYAYCARLFHLMHVEGRWADNAFTLDGKRVHRRVDQVDHVLPDPEQAEPAAPAADSATGGGEEPPEISRSVALSSEQLGLTAKLDLVSTAGDEAVPLERKRGKVPNNPERSWEPERVQLMAQGLLLREHGYHCDHGMLYFAGSRTRVQVPFGTDLEARTRALVGEARAAMQRTAAPPPLVDSPKCHGCSLAGICLPDETLALLALAEHRAAPPIRRLYPIRDDALPLYVQAQGAIVGKSGNCLTVRKEGEELAKAHLKDVSQLVLCGNIMVTAQTFHLLCEAGIPIVHLSSGNWFYGITCGISLRNSYNRAAQFEAAADPARQLRLAKAIVKAKGANQRTMLRRNALPRPDTVIEDMARYLDRVDEATAVDQLLGLEGALAAAYFGHLQAMVKAEAFSSLWAFEHRNRRPPRDPINAMLSFAYALLTKECVCAVLGEGLEPWWGIYHQPRHGRPGLALDLMEEFRPLLADSAVLSAINTGMVHPRDFECSAAGCSMRERARKALIQAYEARLDQLVTHPLFDYRCSWRSTVRVQARLLARWCRGELPEYIGFTTR
jgi:CRISPR-associated protein Cas1